MVDPLDVGYAVNRGLDSTFLLISTGFSTHHALLEEQAEIFQHQNLVRVRVRTLHLDSIPGDGECLVY
jgi:hypothetical protein